MNHLLLHPRTQAELMALLRDTPHALLFVAPHGMGKRAVAEAWAQQFTHASAISALEPDEKGTIGIDAARGLYQRTRARQEGHQVVIIDHASAMTIEAQNAFLKLLEEPRAGLTFILTAPSSESLLPTVLSRVQVVHFQLLNQQTLTAHIANLKPVLTPQEVQQFLFVAQGRPAVLSRILQDDQAFAAYKQIMQHAKFLLSAPVYERLALVQELSKDKATAIATLEAMAHMLALQLRRTPATAQLALVQVLQTCLNRLQQNGNVRAQLTHLFLGY